MDLCYLMLSVVHALAVPGFLLASIIILLHMYFREIYSVFDKLKIQGPKPTPLFGNSIAFKSKFILDVFADWYKTYGKVYGPSSESKVTSDLDDLFMTYKEQGKARTKVELHKQCKRYYEGLTPSLVVSHPEMIKEILGKQFYKFHDRTRCIPFLYWPDNINMVNAKGCQWKRERTVTATAFNATSLREMVSDVTKTADRLIQCLDRTANEPVDIADWSDRYAIDSFALAAFGFPVCSLENPKDVLLRYMRANFEQGDIDNPLTGIARLFPGLIPLLTHFNGKYKKIHFEHLENVKRLISDRKKQFDAGEMKEKNLLTSLLTAQTVYTDDQNNNCKRGLTDDEMVSQVHSLIGAGFGQTNNLLAFAVYNLAQYPHVQEKAWQEVDRLCNMDESLEYDTLARMDYLDAVLFETLRVFPIAPGVTRTCNEGCLISGVHIPEGTVVRLMASPMYQDPSIYPEPLKFDPHRFTPEEKARRHPQSFLGFGYGPRMCVGWRLGLLQCKVALVRLLQRYHIDAGQQGPIKTTMRPVLCPKDCVLVKLRPR